MPGQFGGYADVSTTADTYAHLTARMRDRAAARMDRLIGRRVESS